MYSKEICQMGELIQKRIKEDYYDTSKNCFPNFDLRTTDRPKFDKLLKEYYRKDAEDRERFKSDLIEFGKLHKLNEEQLTRIYGFAWEEGHDCGYWDVFSYFIDAISMYLSLREMEDKGIELLGELRCHT